MPLCIFSVSFSHVSSEYWGQKIMFCLLFFVTGTCFLHIVVGLSFSLVWSSRGRSRLSSPTLGNLVSMEMAPGWRSMIPWCYSLWWRRPRPVEPEVKGSVCRDRPRLSLVQFGWLGLRGERSSRLDCYEHHVSFAWRRPRSDSMGTWVDDGTGMASSGMGGGWLGILTTLGTRGLGGSLPQGGMSLKDTSSE